MPYTETGLPLVLSGALPGHGHQQPLTLASVIAVMSNHHRPSRKPEPRRRSSAKSVSSSSSKLITTPAPLLRLADVAKQHSMGIHTEAWREEILPARQYLPMQHIIGSLKRDRDEGSGFPRPTAPSRHRSARNSLPDDVNAACSRSEEDRFLQMLGTPKRRRTLDNSYADIPISPDLGTDWILGIQNLNPGPIAKEIPPSVLPNLNHALRLSTIAPSEQDIFSEYAPHELEDPQFLMNDVFHFRDDMMQDTIDDDSPGDLDDTSSTIDTFSPVVPPEREIEVRKAFEEFIDYNDSKRYIAKI